MTFPVVDLSPANHVFAATEGFLRMRNNAENSRRSRHSNTDSRWGAHIEAAGSECAVSLWTGEPWSGKRDGVFGPPWNVADVGDDIEVRRIADRAKCVLRVDEKDFAAKVGRRFVLARGMLPSFELRGWIFLPATPDSYDRRKWRVEHRERITWEVPADFLLPMSSFVRKRDAA